MNLIKEMFEGVDGIDESIKTKAETLVEAYVNEQVKNQVDEQVKTALESINEQFEGHKETFITESTAKLDEYVNEQVKEWAKDNAVAIDNSIKVELAEKFLEDIKGVLTAAGVQLTESEKADVDGLQVKLSESVAEVATLKGLLSQAEQVIAEAEKTKVIAEAVVGLADTQADRVKRLAEGFAFTDVDAFKEKVGILVEAFTEKKDKKDEDKKPSDKDDVKPEDGKEGKDVVVESSLVADTLKLFQGRK